MLNEDKIKLMTGTAMFEKKEGKHIFPITRYFGSDYISSHMFRSFFAWTICFLLGVMVWVLCSSERLLALMDLGEYVEIGKQGLKYYLIGLVVYLLITFFVYRRRYEYARRGMKVYIAKLKRLEKRYEFQSRAKELTKEGSRHDGASRA
ncbi:MAG: hypothetical protein LIO81_03705 [Clostridiales bacterium]|nr:hypothetical protein [Clostridiales bacterium]